MKVVAALFALACPSVSGAYADTCEAKAREKNGKPLAGAAKTSGVSKCVKDSGA